MRLVSLAVMLATALVACTREPAVAGVSPNEPVDVSGIPSEIRVLVAASRSHYYLEDGVARGLTPHLADQFEQWLNAQSKSATFDVELIETPQDALIRDLLAGKGDVAANLLLTFERDDQVAFTKPVHSGIRELISPTITAAATVLILFSTFLLITVELLRRRSERLRGIRN